MSDKLSQESQWLFQPEAKMLVSYNEAQSDILTQIVHPLQNSGWTRFSTSSDSSDSIINASVTALPAPA